MSKTCVQDQLVDDNEDKLAVTIERNEQLQQRLQTLTSSWEAERSELRIKIIHLEHSLVDAIERSNNPLRAQQLTEGKVRLLEDAKREWSAQWSVERTRLLTEIRRLRQLATSILSCDVTVVR
jgi:hypothetical protein